MSGWAWAFVACMLVWSLAWGLIALVAPRVFPLPAHARFIAGMALAPQLLGHAATLMMGTFPRFPWWQFFMVLFAFCAYSFMRHGSLLLRRLRRANSGTLARRAVPRWIAAIAVVLLCGVLATALLQNARAPLIAFDALQYAREATLLGAGRDMQSWVGHTGSADGTLRGDIHHPVFSGYLAVAQQFTSSSSHAADEALRAALQLTFACMLLAMLLPGFALRWGWWSFTVLPLVLLVPQFDYVSSSSSRDAFRLVPLCLLGALAFRMGQRPSTWHAALPFAPALTAGAALALMGHTLNAFVVVSLMSGFGAWALLSGRWRPLVIASGSVGLGLLMGGWTYATAWLESGSVQGSGVLMYGSLAGTPMLEVIRHLEVAAAKGVVAPLERLQEALFRDARGVALAGCLVCVAVLAHGLFWRRGPSAMRFAEARMLAATCLAIALPVLGAFDFGSYQVSQWFVTNQRYALHWYLFLALALAAPLATLKPARAWLRPVLLALLCIAAYALTLRTWYRNTWDFQFVADRLQPMLAVQPLLGDRRLVLEDARWNYYLDNRHVVMYARATAPLFSSAPGDAMDQALATLRIGGAVLQTASLKDWWAHSHLLAHFNRVGACRIDFVATAQTLFLLPSVAEAKICEELRRTMQSARQ